MASKIEFGVQPESEVVLGEQQFQISDHEGFGYGQTTA